MRRYDPRIIVSDIFTLLETDSDRSTATLVRDALSASDTEFDAFLVSNELWGGSGSIADQSCLSDDARRGMLEGLLVELGNLQIGAGKTNVRTAGWVAAFESWRRSGTRQS
jgi:hypothetical protein